MNKKYSKEELYHSLPDYISGKITDPGLISLIKNEIEVNPEFREEYNDFSDAFNFLDSAQFESPSDNYFNNLPVKINELINQEKQPESFFEKLFIFRKLFIPAGIAIITAFILISIYNNDQKDFTGNTEKTISQSLDTNISVNKEKQFVADTVVRNSHNSDSEELRKTEPVILKREFVKLPVTIRKNFSTIIVDSPSVLVKNDYVIRESHLNLGLIANNIQNIANSENDADQEEDILFVKDIDEDNIDEDILKLTPEEEKEILENLYKSQI